MVENFSFIPTVKPVPSPSASMLRVPPPGMCYYHPNLPAVYVCNRCGRPLCRDDAKAYNDLILCPQCYQMVPTPRFLQISPVMPLPAPMEAYPSTRATWGFLTSLIAGIMIIINAAALLSLGFYTFWTGIFPWIPFFGAFPPWVLFAIGLILGVITCIGSVLMILGYGTIGAVVVFPAVIISLIMGGGFIVGFVLGIVGGIMAMLGR